MKSLKVVMEIFVAEKADLVRFYARIYMYVHVPLCMYVCVCV